MNLVDCSPERVRRGWAAIAAEHGLVIKPVAGSVGDVGDVSGQDASNDTPEEPAVPQVPTAEVLKVLLPTVAEKGAPNWELQPDELVALSESWGPLIDKYFPDRGYMGFLDKYSLELTAAWTTYQVFNSRRGVPLRAPEPEQNNNEEGVKSESGKRPEKPKQYMQPDEA